MKAMKKCHCNSPPIVFLIALIMITICVASETPGQSESETIESRKSIVEGVTKYLQRVSRVPKKRTVKDESSVLELSHAKDDFIEIRYVTEGRFFWMEQFTHIAQAEPLKKEDQQKLCGVTPKESPEERKKPSLELPRIRPHNGDPICPVEITVRITPKTVRFGEPIKIRIFVKNVGDEDYRCFTRNLAPSAVTLWFSSEHIQDVYPCLVLWDRYVPEAVFDFVVGPENILLSQGQEMEMRLIENEFMIPDLEDVNLPFWKLWLELPEDQKDCVIHLRIQHSHITHPVSIHPISDDLFAEWEKINRHFHKTYPIIIRTHWDGTLESIPSAYKERIMNKENLN